MKKKIKIMIHGVKRDIIAMVKHPVLFTKFLKMVCVLGFRSGEIKALWDNMFYFEAAEKAKEQKPLIDEIVDIMIGVYDTDYNHVRVEINPNSKYGCVMYIND